MKKYYFYILLMILATPTGCTVSSDKSSSGGKETNEVSETADFKQKVLLIIAEDRSGSTKNQKKMTADHYEKIFNAFNNKYCGEIDVLVIGNPSPQEQNFYPLVIDCPEPLKKIPSGALLTQKAHIKKQNDQILLHNKQLIGKNKDKIHDFVQSVIRSKVSGYKPYRGKDLTDIKTFFEHLRKKINEPTYANFNQILIVVISDGIHDAFKLKEPLRFRCNPKLRLFLVGWKDKKMFENCHTDEFESVDGFVNYFMKIP